MTRKVREGYDNTPENRTRMLTKTAKLLEELTGGIAIRTKQTRSDQTVSDVVTVFPSRNN
jgi:transcriptional regulator of heat shock response